VWFRVNVGRAHHADPKWLVPLLCRRGNIKKDDLGRIAIGAKETHVEIAPHLAARFSAAVQEPDAKDPRVKIVPLDD
jgi:ATP-dependent RNA helicase DeaD